MLWTRWWYDTDSMSYKTFVWPNNPRNYKEQWSRDPQFSTENGVSEFLRMGPLKGIITGSGAFFGDSAYEQFRSLMELAEENTPGDLRHPLWGIRQAYLTGLELVQEPRENYVGYSFEFTCADANGEVPK